MAQILNVRHPRAQLAAQLGAGLGEGLASLAEAKLNRMQQDQNIRQYTSAGVDPVSARFIAQLPAEQRIPALSRYLDQGQGFPGEQPQQYQQQEQYQQQPENGMQALQQSAFQTRMPQSQSNLANLLENNYSSPIAPQFLEGLLKTPQQKQQVQQQQQALEQQQILANQAQQAQQQPQQIAPAQIQPQLPQAQPQKAALTNQQKLARALGQAGAPELSPKEKLAEERATRKETFEREKFERAERDKADTATKGYYDERIEADKAAVESDRDLKKMKTLIKKGKLPFSFVYKTLKDLEDNAAKASGIGSGIGAALGGGLGGLPGAGAGYAAGGLVGGALSPIASAALYAIKGNLPDTEEFEKLSAGFLKYAKGIFGARITDADLKAFYNMVPTLSQTDHGKLAIIKNMELFNQAIHAETEAMEEIIKENKGHRPLDLALQVKNRSEEKLNKIADMFENNTEKEEARQLLKR